MVKGHVNFVLVPVDTKKVGTQGLALKYEHVRKQELVIAPILAGLGLGSVCVSLHEGSRLCYLGVCMSIHYSSADTESFRRFLPSEILLR